MANKGRVRAISESDTGRNLLFYDTQTKKGMSRAEFVRQIDSGEYPNYHIRKINGLNTPVSNPNYSGSNNLD